MMIIMINIDHIINNDFFQYHASLQKEKNLDIVPCADRRLPFPSGCPQRIRYSPALTLSIPEAMPLPFAFSESATLRSHR